MANYECTTRTNYFHVNDVEGFKNFMKTVYGSEDNISLWENKDKNDNIVFGFGCYGGIAGIANATEDEEDCDETSFDEFISGLQKFVAEDDAIIILEAGNEKMRYIVGSATVITHDKYEYLDITHLAISKASEMLGNDNFHTVCEY